MGIFNNIFETISYKLSGKRGVKIEKNTVFLIFLIIFAGISYVYVNYFQLDTKANVLCPFPESPAKIHGQIVLTPTSEEGIFDCSGKDIIIASDGDVIVARYVNFDGSITGDYGAEILFKNLTIESGGRLRADGRGYRPGETDGSIGNAYTSDNSVGGSGGGYGGAGGEGINNGLTLPGNPGQTYGDATNPILLGGSGGNTGFSTTGGNGGGAIKLTVSEILTINGVISANGDDGLLPTEAGTDNVASGGGGAGGSIWIEANSFTGNGQILANGGGSVEAIYQGGGGGGGRIQMFCTTTNSFSGITTVEGGSTSRSQDGGAGTLLGPTCRPNIPTILKQYKLNLATEVPVGGATAEASFYLAANLSDPDINNLLYLDVEVRPIGTAFTNQVTHSQNSGLINPQACTGTANTCGRINVTGLARSTQYHWQARVRDNKGGISAWVSYGGNTEDLTDILISGQASNIAILDGNNQSGIVNTNLTNPLKIKVTDSNGFPVPGFTVSWSVPNGANGGGLLGNIYTETNIDGEASNTYRLGKQSGLNFNIIRAIGSGLSGSPVNFSATGTPDIINYFILSVPDVSLVDVNFNLLIKAYDQFNNIKSDLDGTVDISAVDPLNTATPKLGILTPNQVVFTSGDGGQKTIAIAYNTSESIKVKAIIGTSIGYSNTIAVVTTLGSCPDVDGIIDTNQTWVATTVNNGIFDCTGLTIRVMTNAILTLQSYNNGDTNYTNDFGATVLATGLEIEPGSTITANEKGYPATKGPGAGGSYGGYGNTDNPYGDYANPILLGSGGTQYNTVTLPGGGAIKLVVNSMTVNGTLSSNGGTTTKTGASATGTGSSGGSIFIVTDTINGTGVIKANGGAAPGGDYYGRGGSGGRIAIYYKSGTFPLTTKTNLQAFGANGPNSGYGGPGTIFLDDTDDTNNAGMLYINNNGVTNGRSAAVMGVGPYSLDLISVKEYGHLSFVDANSVVDITTGGENAIAGDGSSTITVNGIIKLPTTFSLKKYRLNITGDYEGANILTVGEPATNPAAQLTIYAYTTKRKAKGAYNDYQFTNLTVDTTGIVSLQSYNGNAGSTADNDANGRDDYGVILDITNQLEVKASGQIEADKRGYSYLTGPGSGGSYGGYGQSGTPYGNPYQPQDLGSGGGKNGSASTEAAGGAIKIQVPTLILNGIISANGGTTWATGGSADGSGSSGGSVWIEAGTINGTTGLIRTNGGAAPSGHYFGKGGGGGRIAIYFDGGTFNVLDKTKVQTFGGYGANGNAGYAGAGTIYIDNRTDLLTKGSLYVNNNAHNGREAGVPGTGPYEFDLISIKEYGNLKFLDSNVIVDISTGGEDAVAADGTSSLSVAGLIKLPQTFSIKKYTLDVIGDYDGASNLTIGEASGTVGRLKVYAYTVKRRGLGKYNDFSFINLTVQTTGTISLVSYNGNAGSSADNDINGNDDYGVILDVANTLDVKLAGTIEANAVGYVTGAGPGGEGTYGGYGQSGSPYGDLYNPISLGSAGGTNGSGYAYPAGGAIKIEAEMLINNGTISANGGDCVYVGASAYCTGSSGGSILINTVNFDGTTGIVKANGGNAPGGHYFGRGGGGGRIAVYYDSGSYNLADKNRIQAFGGYGANVGYAGAGTIFIDNYLDSLQNGILYINNNAHNGREAGIPGIGPYLFDLISIKEYGHLKFSDPDVVVDISTGGEEAVSADGTATLSVAGLIKLPNVFNIKKFTLDVIGDYEGAQALTVGESSGMSGNLVLYAYTSKRRSFARYNDYSFQTLTVESTGRVSLVSYKGNISSNADNDAEGTNDYGVILNVINLFDIKTGGVVESNNTGYSTGAGPGGEGSYGGYGQSGNPYGDLYLPVSLGTAGGTNGSGYANPAGGAIKIIASTLNNNGAISSNGGDCVYVGASAYCSGSSGGSILIDVTTINGVGIIRTNGGAAPSGHYFGWGGSGGRIAVYYTDGDYDLTNKNRIQSFGGYGGNVGYAGVGTIFIDNKNDSLLKGIIYINNNGHNGKEAGVSGVGPYELDLISIKEYGHLKFGDTGVVVDITTGGEDAVAADGTTSLAVSGLIKLPSTFSIKKFTLDITGDYEGANNLTIGEASGLSGRLKLYAYNSKRRSLDKYNTYQFSNLSVNNTGSIDLVSYNGNISNPADNDALGMNDYGVILDVSNIFEIKSGAIVDSDASGYASGVGPGGEGSYGGYGQSGSPYGSIYEPVDLGTAGGTNGSGYAYPGGGIIKIQSGTLINNGIVSVNGGDCVYVGASAYCSGSSGGSIWVSAGSLDGSGIFRANGGGAPGGHYFGKGGSGGRIAIYFDNTTFNFNDKTKVQTFGGYGPNVGYAGPGTIFVKDNLDAYGSLIIENNNNSGRAQNLLAQEYNFKDVTIGRNILTYGLGDFANNQGVKLNMNGDFYLGLGSRIDGIGQGFQSSEGPGAGQSGLNLAGGGGGANGGNGGNGESDGVNSQPLGGTKYGDQLYPDNLGSGGGAGGTGALGGNGGGSFAVITKNNQVTILGEINMNGTDGLIGSPGGGGGAGGSILIQSNSCTIDGTLSANGGAGGDSSFDGGGGGGGRISIIKDRGLCTTNGTITVSLGLSASGQQGQLGTYFGVVTIPQISLDKQTTTTDVIIPVGGITSENQVKLSAEISDTGGSIENSVELVADFEIIESNQTFPEQVLGLTSISSDLVNYDGGTSEPVTVLIPASLVPGESYKWRARVRNITSGISGTWTDYGSNGDAADFTVSAMDGFEITPSQTTVQVGESIDISIRAIDDINNTVAGYNGTVVFSSDPSTNPSPALPANYTFSQSDSGIHIYTDELIFYVPGTYTITVIDSQNPSINGTSIDILVSPLPTNTPTNVPTNSPTLTPILTPTNFPTDNEGTFPSITPTAVVTSTTAVTGTATSIPSPENCTQNPNQARCQVNVEITNIIVTVNNTDLQAKICWETNISTIGVVIYGETLLSNSTQLETVYATSHCADLVELKSDTGYNFEIKATSEVGKEGNVIDNFIIGKGTVPENMSNCINIDNYSFNADSQLILNYTTKYSAVCNVNYTYLGESTSLFKDSETMSMIYHLSKLNLLGLLEDKDVAYVINCKLSLDITMTDNVQSCDLAGSVPQGKIGIYLPDTGEDTPNVIDQIINAIGKFLPVVTVPLLIGALSSLAIQNPQIFFYGLFWLKLKRKKQAWGLIYDIADKKPVSFAVVRIYDGLKKNLLHEDVTSIDGKYNFLVGEGVYKLIVEHSEYNSVQKDITVKVELGEIAEEMGMIKRELKHTVNPYGFRQRAKLLFIKYNNYLVICGLLITLIATIFTPVWYNYIVLGLYILQEAILLRYNNIRWAKVINEKTGEPMPRVFVRLYDPEEKRQLEVTLTDEKGRYKFLTEEGKWLATAYQEGFVMADSQNEVQSAVQKFVWIEIKKGVTKTDIKLLPSD